MKGKYIYYRCSGYRGKCSTPYFREEEISQKLGEILKNIHVPDDVVHRIEESFNRDQERVKTESATHRERLETAALCGTASHGPSLFRQAGWQDPGRLLAAQDV